MAEYEAKCVVVAGKAGRAAASERNVRKFVEVSSASVYKPDDVCIFYTYFRFNFFRRDRRMNMQKSTRGPSKQLIA